MQQHVPFFHKQMGQVALGLHLAGTESFGGESKTNPTKAGSKNRNCFYLQTGEEAFL